MKRLNLSNAETVEMVSGIHVSTLVTGESMSSQHARIEPGASVDVHTHPNEQLSYVLRGELTFVRAEGETVTVGPGESVVMSAGEAHGAENRGDEPVEVIEAFSPPRDPVEK